MKTQLKSLKLLAVTALLLIVTNGCGNGRRDEQKINNDSPASPQNNQSPDDGANKPQNTQTTSFDYWFIRNGCSTEKQTFESKEALCKGLQDRELNKNCALDLRQEKFKNVGCSGEFAETRDVTTSSNKGPSPVKCAGYVRGISGEKKIEQIIHWDRKNYQKIILSNFTDVKDAGEYSVHLTPHEDPTKPGAIKIFGWFIDNNKNQSIEGRLDSRVYFYHKDKQLNDREVEIECGLMSSDIQAPTYSKDEKLEMTCLGTRGPIKGKKNFLNVHFFWDQQTPLTEILLTEKENITVKSDIEISAEINKESGLPTMKVTSHAIDGHVQLIGEVHGRMEFTIKYMSAWDNRDINISCAPRKVWNEVAQKISEKKNDENKK